MDVLRIVLRLTVIFLLGNSTSSGLVLCTVLVSFIALLVDVVCALCYGGCFGRYGFQGSVSGRLLRGVLDFTK